jgi:dipeptidase E
MWGDIYLGGGGSEAQEDSLWNEAFPAGATVAVWPFAQRAPEDRERSIAWMRATLAPHGVVDVEGWMAPDSERSLARVDVIAIPGGNTFELLHTVRSSGLLTLLRRHLRAGGRLYGGSAGAVLAGADIGIAQIADRNDAGVTDARALDLLGSIDVLPHYTRGQREWAQARSEVTNRSILCLPEASGAVVRDGRVRNVGPESIEVVGRDAVQVLEPGRTFALRVVDHDGAR